MLSCFERLRFSWNWTLLDEVKLSFCTSMHLLVLLTNFRFLLSQLVLVCGGSHYCCGGYYSWCGGCCHCGALRVALTVSFSRFGSSHPWILICYYVYWVSYWSLLCLLCWHRSPKPHWQKSVWWEWYWRWRKIMSNGEIRVSWNV